MKPAPRLVSVSQPYGGCVIAACCGLASIGCAPALAAVAGFRSTCQRCICCCRCVVPSSTPRLWVSSWRQLMTWRVIVCCFMPQIMQDHVGHQHKLAAWGSHCLGPFECKLAAPIA